MHIVHIASELAPIAKAGGLGDVIYGLSQELRRTGHRVDILLPKYDCTHYEHLTGLKVAFRELWSFDGHFRYNNTVWSAELHGLRVLLVEPHHPHYYYSRGVIYGCPDDVDRFAYFSRTSLEYLFKTGERPDVIHIHDWPTALAAPLYKEMYVPLGMEGVRIVLTIHNMQHQGLCAPHNLSKVGLRGDSYLTPERMQDPFRPGTINLLKGGVAYADAVTTVSPTYEKEIMTPEGGHGLDLFLLQHAHKLTGILNGIDTAFWNPATDPHLVAHYSTEPPCSTEQIERILAGKAKNREHVRTHLQLRDAHCPVVASVTRLVPQKAPELIERALVRTLEQGGQFILLGASSDPDTHKHFIALRTQYADHGDAGICLDQDEALAHLIYAAADFLVIPSLFEPCGLTQMIALRYGAIPIARKTGGLADTVFDIETSARPPQERNGFTFDFPDCAGLDWALDRALACWQRDPQAQHKLIQQGCAHDFSWTHAAQEYVTVYTK
jgi:starch synthase